MPVFARTLRTLRWHIAGYGIGLALWAVLVAILFPTLRETYAQMDMPEAYREMFGMGASVGLGDFRTFASVEFLQWIPVVLAIYVITAATGALAGEEGRGSLEILLAQPVSRRALFAQKAVGLAVGAIAITAVAAAGIVVSVAFIDTGGDLTLLQLGAATFGTLPLVLLTGSLALLLAAVAPSRGTSAAIAATVVVAAWLANGLGGLASQTEWLKYLSGFYYADIQTVLTGGLSPWHQAVVLAVSAAQIGLAMLAFARREIEVSRWQIDALRAAPASPPRPPGPARARA